MKFKTLLETLMKICRVSTF